MLMQNIYTLFHDFNNTLHSISNIVDGLMFRKEAVDVHSASWKIIHRGVTPEEKLITALSDALNFLNDDANPVLVRIAVFHYLFAYIHPFYGGNGRTARFISSAYIAKHLHPLIALRLAVTIKRRLCLKKVSLSTLLTGCGLNNYTLFERDERGHNSISLADMSEYYSSLQP